MQICYISNGFRLSLQHTFILHIRNLFLTLYSKTQDKMYVNIFIVSSNKQVSWVRHNPQDRANGSGIGNGNALDLLTVGMHTYTGDKRYKMEFQYPNNWRLKITNVKKDDEAIYECQISTHPPRVIQINLHANGRH